MIYGYARVSSADQNEQRQLDRLKEQGPMTIFVDKQSGKDFNRPRYQKMLGLLKQGDVIFVQSIDRLGRNYQEIIAQWRLITKDIGADIVVLDMPLLDTRKEKNLMGTFIADLVLQILSFCAEQERQHIKTRQRQGIDAARARGVHLGRKEGPLPGNFSDMLSLWRGGHISASAAARECGMAVTSFLYRAKKRGG